MFPKEASLVYLRASRYRLDAKHGSRFLFVNLEFLWLLYLALFSENVIFTSG